MYTLIFIALFIFSPIPTAVCAQESESVKNSAVTAAEDTPRTFPVIPIAFSTNETGAALGLLYNQVLSNGSTDRPDNVQAYTYYSTKKQYSLSLKPSIFLNNSRYHLSGALFAAYTPSTFWGVGRESGGHGHDEDYTSTGRGLLIAGTIRVSGPYRVGMSVSYNRKKINDIDANGILASSSLTGSNGGEDIGFGLLTERDDRDSTFWPTSGTFCKLNATVHRDQTGSDFNYNTYTLDLRDYHAISPDSVLALRVIVVGTGGTPPFYALPQLGGSHLLRGLYGGRYRDRWLYGTQAEYRAHLVGRFSWAAFVAFGNVAERAEQLFDDSPLLTGGSGVRFALDPANRVNLRVDVGISKHGLAPMVMINEAF